MQRLEKSDERGCLRGTQILSIGRHVAATLNDLPDKLVLRETQGHGVEGGPSLSATFSQRVTVTALFNLKYQSSLPLQCGRPMYKLIRHWVTAPRVHVGTPGREPGEMGERSERDRDQHHGQNRDWSALPALFTFAGKKGKKKQPNNYYHRSDQKCWGLERRREQREHSIEPEEKVIWFRNGLDDGRIGPAGRPKLAELHRT